MVNDPALFQLIPHLKTYRMLIVIAGNSEGAKDRARSLTIWIF